jgi:hypothetical protein
MITFAPMPSLALSSQPLVLPSPRKSRRSRDAFSASTLLVGTLLVATLLAIGVGSARAQTTSHTEDAAPVPQGMLRLRVSNIWTRYDERFNSSGGVSPLGADLSTGALGATQLPLLQPIETSLRTLAADPALSLSLGRLEVRSNARIVTTPITLEYGLTRRLSIGILVPVVQTRRTAQPLVNQDPTSPANVGFVNGTLRSSAAAANASVVTAMQNAAAALANLIASCPNNPSASGCAAVNANPSGAAAARTQALQYAGAVQTLGTTAAATLIAPRAGSTLATRVDAQRTAINQQLQQYLGAGAGASTPVFTAPTDFSYLDLQGGRGSPGLLQSPLGGLDSIHTADRLGVGDIAVGAQFMVFDRFQRDTLPLRGVQTRLALGAAVRFATSQRDSARNLVDIPTGEGAGVEVRSALDLIAGRLGGTVAARYAKSFARTVIAPLFGDPDAAFPFPVFGQRQRTAGDAIGLDITPRYFLTSTFALDAHYGFERIGATTYSSSPVVADGCAVCAFAPMGVDAPGPSGSARTAQRVGIGARFSTVDAYARHAAKYPVEVLFSHLETFSGDAGVPKASRDEIQLRLFYWVRR